MTKSESFVLGMRWPKRWILWRLQEQLQKQRMWQERRQWIISARTHRSRSKYNLFFSCTEQFSLTSVRDVPVIHPVPGKCRISHYSVLTGPCKIMGPSNKKKFFYFLFFITVSKKSFGIVDKKICAELKTYKVTNLCSVFSIFLYLLFLVHHVIH